MDKDKLFGYADIAGKKIQITSPPFRGSKRISPGKQSRAQNKSPHEIVINNDFKLYEGVITHITHTYWHLNQR